MALPARVRVTRPSLPLAPALRQAAEKICPDAPVTELQAAAFAIAGGSVIGVQLRWANGEIQALDTGWRGRGIEEALRETIQPNA